MVPLSATTPRMAPWFGYRGRTASCWCAASRRARRAEQEMPVKASILPMTIDFSRWRSRDGKRSAAGPLVRIPEGQLMKHFRVFDLAAEQSVWSVPPIDTVPWKLRTEKLVVRSIDNDGELFEVVPIDGPKLEDLVTQLLADRRVARLNIHLATDDS